MAEEKERFVFAYQINEELKAEYIDAIRSGMRPNLAAEKCHSTGHQFRKLRRPTSQHYDAEFAAAVEEAFDSGEHRKNRQEWLRGLSDRAADAGERWAIEKLSLIELPEWESLRHQNLRIDHQVDIALSVLPGLTREELDRAIAAKEVEVRELKALPPPAEDVA